MENLLNQFFPSKGMGNLKMIVGASLAACIMALLHKLLGGLGFIYYPIVIILLIFPVYAAAQHLMPKMDPRDPDTDRFVIWGTAATCVLLGFVAFGILFLPVLLLTGGLVFWRAPDLLEILPWMDSGDHKINL